MERSQKTIATGAVDEYEGITVSLATKTNMVECDLNPTMLTNKLARVVGDESPDFA